MRCPVCATDSGPNARSCEACGTRFRFQRILFGAEPREFSLTADEEVGGTAEDGRAETLPFVEQRNGSNYQHPPVDDETTGALKWGGFFRRVLAFIIDLVVVVGFCAVLFVVCVVVYRVGLAAYGRTLSAENSHELLTFLVGGWMFLTTSYFVLFHGMAGQTVGKWLFGLRVVGEDGAHLSYKQAIIRWLSGIFLAPFVISVLWIIWSREKRAWHDYLARSWVIRE
jgi:uncharacterized RDD family membrane protein YckC